MARRPPLGGGPPRPPAKHAAGEGRGTVARAAPAEPPVRTPRARSRQGKLQFAGYLDLEFKRQIDVFAAREGRSLQSIFEEMYDMFAERHGLHRIAGTQ
jgi:hypothetical protein